MVFDGANITNRGYNLEHWQIICIFANVNVFLILIDMKKILLALVAVIGICALSSCSKSCNCKAYYNDNVVEKTITPEDGKKCSDYNTYVKLGKVETGTKCVPALF